MELQYLLEVVLHGRAAPIVDPRACCYWLLFALSHHQLPRQLLRPQQLLWPQQLQHRQLPPLRQLLPLCPQHRQEECRDLRWVSRVSVCLQIGAGKTRLYASEQNHHVLVIVKVCVCSVFPNWGPDLFNVRVTFCLQGLHSSPAMSAKSSRQAFGAVRMTFVLLSTRIKKLKGTYTTAQLRMKNHSSPTAPMLNSTALFEAKPDGTNFALSFSLGGLMQCNFPTDRTV